MSHRKASRRGKSATETPGSRTKSVGGEPDLVYVISRETLKALPPEKLAELEAWWLSKSAGVCQCATTPESDRKRIDPSNTDR